MREPDGKQPSRRSWAEPYKIKAVEPPMARGYTPQS